MITLLVVTDGRRDCITRTIPSALEMVVGPITRRVIFDDSGDPDVRAWLRSQFPTFELAYHPLGRVGFGGAIQTAWRYLGLAPQRFIFHCEDDFTFNRPVDLHGMMSVLLAHPYLVQLALRRQPWNDTERRAGGIVESHPDAYQEMFDTAGRHWLEHRQFFTTNPCLYRRSLCQVPWPEGPESEGHFSAKLREDEHARFGFWGSRDSGEWVTHIGQERVGTGY